MTRGQSVVHGVVALTIPAKAEYIVLSRLALSGLARARALEPALVADLKLALTEACSNVVRHAYKEQPAGEVEVRYELDIKSGDSGSSLRFTKYLA